jgi:hypothetical protein
LTAGKPARDSNVSCDNRLPDKETMMRHTGFLTLGLLLTLAACGQPAAGDQVASAGGTPTAGATSAAGRDDDAPLKFSQCMREQGLAWFPDPQPGGGLQIKVPEGTPKEKVDAAMEACKEFAPDGGDRGEPDPEHLAKARLMSQCMRDNGVPNFPDPDPNGNMHVERDKVGAGPGDPVFDKADEVCRKLGPQPGDLKREEGGK